MTKKQKNKVLSLCDLILIDLKNMSESAIKGNFINFGESKQAIIFAITDLKQFIIYGV